MASADLMKLYQLHLIDVGILEVRKKAAVIEGGKKLQADLEAYGAEVKALENAYHKAHAEQRDLELSNQQIDDKVKSIDKLLFSGSVTNSKEVEAYETQVKSLKAQKDSNEEKLLLVWDEVEAAEKTYKDAQKIYDEKATNFDDWKKKALVFKSQLEAKFKELSAKRPAATQGIDATLIARYEAIKKNHHGIGVALITREQTCEECGTQVATKNIELIKDDRTVTCEECQRILYWTGGIV